ncbi:MAG: tRNA uridine 5-oxyacetic acid(34) methyltransferase CmoM [Proteobacteria bacterium]|nr:MAG: tRNA uridine 5-oxyacetic acid(34) methyltransferase CmoM [Pseudomonadota bacterium]PIE40330.1 MAG: tRNA uridine 5-oxyacetic acid(34) methyltransferase CmoM [Gammaproteobacteria bacterium]
MSDRYFDELADKFARKIYNNKKGEIRLGVLWQDMLTNLPGLSGGQPLRILDAGAGMGQIALRLAELGHCVTLVEPSEKMMQYAQQHIETADVESGKIQTCCIPIQDMPAEWSGQFDIVVCHAVMEWLSEPFGILPKLLAMLKPGGHLSLMFYNRHSVILRNLIKGNFKKVNSGEFSGYKNSLTPTNPIEPEEVYRCLNDHGMSIKSRAGIRVFSDYLSREVSDARSLEDTLELEKKFCHQEPWVSIARYIHLVAER